MANAKHEASSPRRSEPSAPALSAATPTLAQPLLSSDLEIRVTTEDDGGVLVLDYVLHSPNGRFELNHKHFRGVRLHRPDVWQKKIHHTLENLHRSLDSRDAPLTHDEVTEDLAALGEELCGELFPSELQRTLREVQRAETALLITDEPWIPWEIVKPYDSDASWEGDDGFLASRFQLTRWLAGGRPPAACVEVDRLTVVEAGSPPGLQPLTKAEDELRFLRELAARYGVDEDILTDATHADVGAHLHRHDFGLIHFVGHGEYEAKDPSISGFHLCDGRTLRPRDMRRDIQRRLRDNRPMVFLNACQAGSQGWSLTRPEGWAQRFIRDAGCGAFIAPQWTIDDNVAHSFAKAFYGALERGETFGRARLEAHLALSEEPLGRLAYAVYAHPNGQLRLGKTPPAVQRLTDGRRRRAGADVEKNCCEADFESKISTTTKVDGGTLGESCQHKIETHALRTRRATEPLVPPRISRRDLRGRYLPQTGLRPSFWKGIMVAVFFLVAGLATVWQSRQRDYLEFNSWVMAIMRSIESLDLWILAMFGLGMFFWVTFKVLKKSKVGQFDGDQSLRFFRIVIAFPFLLALAGIVVLIVQSSSSSRAVSVESLPSKEERIKRLTLDLKSEDPTESRQAMESLVPYGAEAAYEIVQAVSEEAGVLAADLIDSVLDGSMIEVLLKTALGPKPWNTPFMSSAIESLARIGEPAITPILEQLGAESLVAEDILNKAEAQKAASQAQRQEASPSSDLSIVGQWHFFLSSTTQSMRIAIAKETLALSLLGIGQDATPALLDALESPRWLVRLASYQVLSQMPEAYELTARRLRDMAERSDNEVETKQLLADAEAIEEQIP